MWKGSCVVFLRIFRKFFGGALIGLSIGSPVYSETMQQALQSAYESSDILAQKDALLRIAKEDHAMVMAQLLPIIQFSRSSAEILPRATGVTTDTISTSTLSASWKLFSFGAVAAGKNSANEMISAAEKTLSGTTQLVFLSAIEAYLSYGATLEHLKATENNMRVISAHLEAAKERFFLGGLTRTDVAQAEARLAQAQAALSLAKGKVEIKAEAYKTAIGHAPDTVGAADKLKLETPSKEAATQTALANHPDIKAQQHMVKAAEFELKATEASRFPTVNFSKSLSRDNVNDDKLQRNSSLIVSVPIYKGGELIAKTRKSSAQLDLSLANLHQISRQISESAANSWVNLMVAQEQLSAAQEGLRSAKIAYEGVSAEADFGTRTLLDVLNSEQEFLNAKTAHIDALANLDIAHYRLLAAMGLLTMTTLGLESED